MLKKLLDSETGKELAAMMADLDQKTQALCAADIAEHVLRFFEEERPNDKRPRRAIEGARAWARGKIRVGEARKLALASHAAAREAKGGAAIAAARAAGHAVATAHVARHSNGAWMYAAKSAFHAGGQKGMEREMQWQRKRLGNMVSPDLHSPKVTERIYAQAFELLEKHPEGLRWTDLLSMIIESDPAFHPKTVNGCVWKLAERYPELVYKPSKGVFRLVKYK